MTILEAIAEEINDTGTAALLYTETDREALAYRILQIVIAEKMDDLVQEVRDYKKANDYS